MPKVSVIVPNYNHARFLRQRIESVLRQTYQDFELILLDDCSTDESRSILSEYEDDPRVRMEFNDKNSGSTFKQWNKGVELARGDYVWIAESDDYADERLLERLVDVLDEEPEVVFVYCRSWRVSEDGGREGFADNYLDRVDPLRWKADFRSDGPEECRNYFIRDNPVPNASAVIFRKLVYKRVGGADESLVFCGDWKTWASMALVGGKIAYVCEPLNYYRYHESRVTANSRRIGLDAAESLKVIRWILQKVTPTPAIQKKVCDDFFSLWCSTVVNNRVPFSRRWTILMDARAIDPNALRRLVRPVLVALRMTLSRRYRSLRLRF